MKHIEQQPTSAAIAGLKLLAKKHRSWEGVVLDTSKDGMDARESLKSSLASEQASLCCYCEQAVDANAPTSHIEHIQPRKTYPQRTFVYENLACSCNGRTGADRHCGHLKSGDYDEEKFVSPHSTSIDGLLSYDPEGGIEAKDQARAETADHMIQCLGLDCPQLTSMRKAHGNGLVDTIGNDVSQDLDLVKEIAKYYLLRDERGSLQPFFSLSRQIFSSIGEEILSEPSGNK